MKKKTSKLNHRRKRPLTQGMTLQELNQPVKYLKLIIQIETDALAVCT